MTAERDKKGESFQWQQEKKTAGHLFVGPRVLAAIKHLQGPNQRADRPRQRQAGDPLGPFLEKVRCGAAASQDLSVFSRSKNPFRFVSNGVRLNEISALGPELAKCTPLKSTSFRAGFDTRNRAEPQ